MRKLFSLFAIASLLFVACDNGGNDSTVPTIKLTSADIIEMGAEGGDAEILYTLANGNTDEITVSEDAAWLDTEAKDGKVVVTIEANTAAAREAKITLKYYNSSAAVTVKQQGNTSSEYDVEFVAKRFEGIYFGTEYSSTPNYYVIISDCGAASNGSPKANGTYYFFDMYHKNRADEACPILPNGNYTYDTTNSYTNLTFCESWYAVMDANGEYAKTSGFANASVSVTDNKFEAIVELKSGEKHHILFEGKLQTTIGHILSTFTEDTEFAVEDANITATLYGDTTESGQQNWLVEAVKGNDLFIVECFNSSTTSPDGLYQIFDIESSDYANRYLPGMLGSEGLVGSWYAKLTNNSIKGDVWAPLTDGVIRVASEGNNLTIELGCKDDAGNNITGAVSGAVTIADAR